jgi:hypothetical protein
MSSSSWVGRSDETSGLLLLGGRQGREGYGDVQRTAALVWRLFVRLEDAERRDAGGDGVVGVACRCHVCPSSALEEIGQPYRTMDPLSRSG